MMRGTRSAATHATTNMINPMEFQNETEAALAEEWSGVGWSAASGSHSVPVRVQLHRYKGWKMPDNTVKVDRSTRWGNPFKVGKIAVSSRLGYRTPACLLNVLVQDDAHAVRLFEQWLYSESDHALSWRISANVIRGKNLACWCPIWRCGNGHKFGNEIKPSRVQKYCLDCGRLLVRAACHADTLLQLANK